MFCQTRNIETHTHGKPRLFVNSGCVDLISELMEINEEAKGNDYAVDGLRYVLVNRENVIQEIKVFSSRSYWQILF